MAGTFVAREKLPGQRGTKLYPIRCSNPECGKNKNTGRDSGGSRLLGHYYAGTRGQVQCPRCGFMNNVDVKEPERCQKSKQGQK